MKPYTDKWLEKEYMKIVNRAVKQGLITQKEWDTRFKDYRDEYGHSFVHYLECVMYGANSFLTLNPIMIKHKKEFKKRFGVEIWDLEDAKKLK